MTGFFAAIILLLHMVWWLVVFALGAFILFIIGYAIAMVAFAVIRR